MDAEERIARVRKGWALALGDAPRVSTAFYAEMFRRDPTTKPLFVNDIALQGRKLMETLSYIVDTLDDPDMLLPAARDLAMRHVAYGVSAPQYAAVGGALIATLKSMLGPEFTAADEQAWSETYAALAGEMTRAAYGLDYPLV